MAAYNKLLHSKLTWMAQQLRYMNDYTSIMNWTAAMTSVRSLIDKDVVNNHLSTQSKARFSIVRREAFYDQRRSRRKSNGSTYRPKSYWKIRRSISPPMKVDHLPGNDVCLSVSIKSHSAFESTISSSPVQSYIQQGDSRLESNNPPKVNLSPEKESTHMSCEEGWKKPIRSISTPKQQGDAFSLFNEFKWKTEAHLLVAQD